MVNLAAAPVENTIFNLSVATKEVLLYNWKRGNGLPSARCRGQYWYMLQTTEGLCISREALVTAEELVAEIVLLYLNRLTFSCCLNCTVCTSFSYSRASVVITESNITYCAKRLFFLQCVTPTRSAVRQFLLN